MKKARWTRLAAAASFALAAGGPVDAHDPGGPGGRGPPAEAIQACSGLQEGASCTVTFGDGRRLDGTCRQGPRGEAVACMPSGPPPGSRFRPPPEAVEACSAREDGAACAFAAPDGNSIEGVCRTGPDGSTKACAPNRPPPGG